MINRRDFLKLSVTYSAGAWLATHPGSMSLGLRTAVPGGSLDPTLIPKYVAPLVIPPAMPRTGKIVARGAKNVDYFEIGVKPGVQQILPDGSFPGTPVWSYYSVNHPWSWNYPAFTIEAKWKKPARVKWINQLEGLQHMLPVDPTLHWANPIGPRDMRPDPAMMEYWNSLYIDQDGRYTGPVPIVTHVHGAHTTDESDGYAEAWFLPAGASMPFNQGSWYNFFKNKFQSKYTDSFAAWTPGSAVFQYPNDQRAATLWYHDHTLGMTRLNVYAGPAGFYLLRGGPDDGVVGTLPGPAPALGDPAGMAYFEIPIAIQDRSFNDDGTLFYPDKRAFFEGLSPSQLQIPFIPGLACDGAYSDVSPIWQPEFFGNTMVVNGVSWPFLNVEQRRYRFRFLNGCNSRFLILRTDNDMPFYQIGSEGGFLPAPVVLSELLMSPAERADVILDFTNLLIGTEVTLLNLAPDEPFGGGIPDDDFDSADPETTGQVMQFRVGPATSIDTSTHPLDLILPARHPLPAASLTRQVSLNEEESATVRVVTDGDEIVVLACEDPEAEPFGPTEALLGVLTPEGESAPLGWMDEISENPAAGATEIWEIHNFTVDAHPIHVHEVMFEVVERETGGVVRPPEVWETGVKDTVIAYPGEITRIKAHFDLPGQYVWHCHIVEHEDNEMMRPYSVGPLQDPGT